MARSGCAWASWWACDFDDLLAAPTATQPARLRVLGKGQKERLVLLTADAYAVLTAWLVERPASDTRHIFLNDRGQPLTVNGIEWLLHQYGQQADVTLAPASIAPHLRP